MLVLQLFWKVDALKKITINLLLFSLQLSQMEKRKKNLKKCIQTTFFFCYTFIWFFFKPKRYLFVKDTWIGFIVRSIFQSISCKDKKNTSLYSFVSLFILVQSYYSNRLFLKMNEKYWEPFFVYSSHPYKLHWLFGYNLDLFLGNTLSPSARYNRTMVYSQIVRSCRLDYLSNVFKVSNRRKISKIFNSVPIKKY